MIPVETAEEQEIVNRVFAANQGHVFRFWNELTGESRKRLLDQLNAFDFKQIAELTNRYIGSKTSNPLKRQLEPVRIIPPISAASDRKRFEQIRKLGEKAIMDNNVAALVVAGGQGTRLGFDGPKGMFPAGCVTGKSLFQLFAERINATEKKYNSTIPWYILTSQQNDAETRAFFKDNQYFNLNPAHIRFFRQGVMPGLTPYGKLILDAKDHISVNPDGHGGSLLALRKSGALADCRNRGIKWLFYFQIDNVLVKICDPLFLGYHIQRDAEMSVKVVTKRDPYEKVGVIGVVDGKVKVIEYSDLSVEEMEACNPNGRLKYNGGNIALHIINVDFIESLVSDGVKLPFHKAFKKIPTIDDAGNPVESEDSNGYKFEMFIFDALPAAREVVVMEVLREEEFSPIKNATGFDSPETARQDMSNFYGQWLEQAGYNVPRDQNGNVTINIEISPMLALEADELPARLPANLDLTSDLYLE
ncbi:UDPGP type 1 family protein [candidate division KSB1 bacterium]|nr:UDPGP type 1 family protein [candidate division KSB1 bacterium]